MYFPLEIWREIKNYMLGQKYWKLKLKRCFFDPTKTFWLPRYPNIKFRDGIKTYYCDIIKHELYYNYNKNIRKYVCYGRPYKIYDIRYEIIYTNL